MAGEIGVRGLADLDRRLTQLVPQAARRAVNAALMAGGGVWEKNAKARVYTVVKKRTGNLKRNIVRRIARSEQMPTVHMGLKREAFYGYFIELGTSDFPARPFLRPAFDSSIQQIITTVADRLRKRIEIEAAKAL